MRQKLHILVHVPAALAALGLTSELGHAQRMKPVAGSRKEHESIVL